MESEWQQVSSSYQDSSQYSGQAKQWRSQDGVDLSSDFQFFQFFFQVFYDRPKFTNYY